MRPVSGSDAVCLAYTMTKIVVTLASNASFSFTSVTPSKVSYLDSTGTALFSYYDSIDFNSTAVTAGFAEGNYVAYGVYTCDSTVYDGTYTHFFRVANQS